MSIVRHARLLALAVLTAPLAASAQTVVNGNFNSVDNGSSSSPDFSGWAEFVNTGVPNNNCNTSDDPGRGNPQADVRGGTGYSLKIESDPAGCISGVRQSLALTQGQGYQISFYAGLRGSGSATASNLFEVILGGQTIWSGQITNSGFQLFTSDLFVAGAGAASTELILQGHNAPQYTVIDDVSITAVTTTPEPASYVLMGSGLLGIMGIAARRRRAS
jgi:hypothetical protein